MIIECSETNIDEVFNYIGADYEKCLYMYIDLVKYGVENENFKVWILCDGNEICGLISQYYTGMQIYNKNYNFDACEMMDFVKKLNPDVISGMEESMYKIKDAFKDYRETVGFVGKLDELTYPPNNDAYSASDEEIEEIAKLVSEDELIGKHYGFESIYKQFCDRRKDNFGRNFISRDESGEIICHTATSAELPNLAVIGSVITAPKYRGKGFSKPDLAAICQQLLLENKEVFSYFNYPPSVKMHLGIGFKKIGNWVKYKK